MRPPSLEPSCPDVREPSDWAMRGLGYWLSAFERREDCVDGRVVPETSGIEHEVVVRWKVAVVSVYLPDIRGPVLIRLLQPAPGLLLGFEVEAGHDGLDANRFRRPKENVERAGEVAKDVGTAAADDDDVAAPGRLFDDVLRDGEDRLAGVEGGGRV